MRVFMTGANGFVGLNVVTALCAAGHQVTAYVRAGSNVSHLQAFGVDIVRGELSDAATLAAAMRGAQAVIHTAGNTSSNPKDWPLLEAANVHGTRNVVQAAISERVPRLVYTSTTSTIGAHDDASRQADEETPLRGFRARNPYAISKRMAEDLVLDACNHDIECVILNPAEVIGAFDHNMQWGRMLLAVHYNQVPFMPPGGASFCDAAEVGRAHVHALTEGRSGERYILGGSNVRYTQLLSSIAEVLKRSFDAPNSNYTWLYLKASLQEKFPALVPGKPVVDAYRMRVFRGTYYFDSGKAERELSYRPGPLEHMLRDCADWYKNHGFMGPVEQPAARDISEQEDGTWISEH